MPHENTLRIHRLRRENPAAYAAYREKEKLRVRAWNAANPERRKAIQNNWKRKNPEKRRAWDRTSRGLPLPTRATPALCECCGRPPGKRALNLDHCHRTGKFRGWLCDNCNTAIGKLGDDVFGLQRAIHYLETCDAD
jgi:hypothetical protein